jgi:hypothetical protein
LRDMRDRWRAGHGGAVLMALSTHYSAEHIAEDCRRDPRRLEWLLTYGMYRGEEVSERLIDDVVCRVRPKPNPGKASVVVRRRRRKR